jgi:hypothetical protein
MYEKETLLALMAWALVAAAITLPIEVYPFQLLAAFAVFCGGLIAFTSWLYLERPEDFIRGSLIGL